MLTEEQEQAAAQLLLVYPGGVGFDATSAEAITIYDELVELGHADVITDKDEPTLPAGGRAYRLSDTAAEASPPTDPEAGRRGGPQLMRRSEIPAAGVGSPIRDLTADE
jgi:hypothetical protein